MIRKVVTVGVNFFLLIILLSATLLLAWAFESRQMPALQSWHTVTLKNEFTAADATSPSSLQAYLDREERLFAELETKIYGGVKPSGEFLYSRYRTGGTQDPAWRQQNWNRTFELVPENIKGGVLLLHGLTDSPYSLRRIGEILYSRGFYVLGLRLPGHGTIPSALTRVNWEDWVAASRIGARHVRARVGTDKPFVMAGYSNGGGLSVKYALDALNDRDLPLPDQLLLFSPEIGIEPLARIANFHKLFSFLPYFEKSKWLSIEPEYDPFKYNSFPKNAAQQAWEITVSLQSQLEDAQKSGALKGFPPILTFLSWTDATVKTAATVQRLYSQLETSGSELVIFDVNRTDRLSLFIPAANSSPLLRLEAEDDLPYRLTVITNSGSHSQQVAQKSKSPHSEIIATSPLSMEWPRGLYSLSHVAIPFAADDPVYGTGGDRQGGYSGLSLGALQPRGETHLLTVSLTQLMRLRYNPFFDYVEQRVVEVIDGML